MRARAAGPEAAAARARRSEGSVIAARCGAGPGREQTPGPDRRRLAFTGRPHAPWDVHSDGVTCESCILIVEDDADLREALTACLENSGCCTAVATDGIDALERLKRSPRPCLILVDVNMPRLDGEALAEVLRNDERLRSIPVVSMSAGDSRLVPPLVHSHLAKPFEFAALAALVDKFCPNRDQEASASG